MRVVDAKFPFFPEGVADPIVVSAESRIGFTFLATAPDGEKRKDSGLAVFRSPSFCQLRHGHPNDEALVGHRFYRAGLDGTTIVEVEDSDWLAEVIAVNRVRFPDSGRLFTGMRHQIFPFKETTLEVLWKDFDFELSSRPFREVADGLVSWVLNP